jgi:hypothetical protein
VSTPDSAVQPKSAARKVPFGTLVTGTGLDQDAGDPRRRARAHAAARSRPAAVEGSTSGTPTQRIVDDLQQLGDGDNSIAIGVA